MNILSNHQEPPEPDYIIMKPASPTESHDVERNGEIENCFKCGHTNYISHSLAASPKPGYQPGTKETLQYKEKRQNKNHAKSSY